MIYDSEWLRSEVERLVELNDLLTKASDATLERERVLDAALDRELILTQDLIKAEEQRDNLHDEYINVEDEAEMLSRMLFEVKGDLDASYTLIDEAIDERDKARNQYDNLAGQGNKLGVGTYAGALARLADMTDDRDQQAALADHWYSEMIAQIGIARDLRNRLSYYVGGTPDTGQPPF